MSADLVVFPAGVWNHASCYSTQARVKFLPSGISPRDRTVSVLPISDRLPLAVLCQRLLPPQQNYLSLFQRGLLNSMLAKCLNETSVPPRRTVGYCRPVGQHMAVYHREDFVFYIRGAMWESCTLRLIDWRIIILKTEAVRSPKHRWPFVCRKGVTCRKSRSFTDTAVSTSELALQVFLLGQRWAF